ncbi:MAG: hypothetical protein ACYTA5_09585 [Planctomycetota bacterium]
MRLIKFSKVLMVICYLGGTIPVMAQPVAKTAFTYQGYLQDGGKPANAAYDMQFSLWTAQVGGMRVAGPLPIPGINVNKGLFTVRIDFDGPVLLCEADWLEIEVKPAGNPPPYTLLVPRQELTPTPFAVCAQTVPWTGITGIPAGFADGVDDNTIYSAGSGIEIVGTTISIASGGVTSTMLADNSVITSKISAGAVTNAKMAAAAIDSNNLVDSAITTSKINNAAITEAKLSNNAVASAKLADSAVISSKINDNAVTTVKLGDGVVTTAKLGAGSVTTGKISPSGASTNDAVMYDGANVVWGNPQAESLILPYSDSVGSDNHALSITNSNEDRVAIHGKSSDGGIGVLGEVSGTGNQEVAVKGENLNSNNYGYLGAEDYAVYGRHSSASFGYIGGSDRGLHAEGTNYGVYAKGSLQHGVYGQGSQRGVWGKGTLYGVYGEGGIYSVYGKSGAAWSGYFDGPVHITGMTTITSNLNVTGMIWSPSLVIYKAGGGFKIDHPLDPANQWLVHSFVESSERKNIYDGVVTLVDVGGIGEAVVELSDWFDSLNKDYRYQLTPIGAPDPSLHIALELGQGGLSPNQFKIAGTPGIKISWQVTGVRQDTWANANPLPVEEPKTP